MSVTRGVWWREKSEMKIKNVFLNWSVHPNGDTLDRGMTDSNDKLE